MSTLKKYVKYVRPVVRAVSEHHNRFHRLRYYELSPEDIRGEHGVVDFITQDKHYPEHFDGNIPCVYAQWGEESGASIVLEISPETRKLLDTDVIVNITDVESTDAMSKWNATADQTVYILMDHINYESGGGFELAKWFADSVKVSDAFDFLSYRLGLEYLNTCNDLELLLLNE
tara:strand:- start:226 stop:747 length:522 start_codon:yes stop_codon:yes gene_type:complete